ncbi:MAG: chemotaxis protein CheA [Desulfobacterales bacterium]|nr:chemotaxis protein CheA [Desulfobacterales bacterium]MCP4163304.1 chemotaxis protein CheA [Deltaproteobacteria bacterium]
MISIMNELVKESDICEAYTLSKVVNSCKKYIEKITLDDIDNLKPIKDGLLLINSLFSHLEKGTNFTFEISDILEQLDVSNYPEKTQSVPDKELSQVETDVYEEEDENILADDLEILTDFVNEAEENLDTIEVNIVELEQDPANQEIINNIFRPFHTIKGVSGFLALKKINKLSHATENLLDSVRSGDKIMNDVITNVIFESVDMLKNLLSRITIGINDGKKHNDKDINIKNLIDKLEILQNSPDKEPLGEILVRKGVINQESIEESIITQKSRPDKKIGEILLEENKVTTKEISSALKDQKSNIKKMAVQVKVDTIKLDDLVDYTGELVIAQSMLKQQATKDPSLHQSISQLGQIVTNIQNIAMSMRMIPIKATFMKMIRLVRDLSNKSDKDVSLIMEGEDTEIDRNLVDALYDPMVHMIRNSVDHGIETKEKRIEKGKETTGNITLRAYHKGGQIVIEIEDDGKGLDKKRILEKAIKTGLVSKEDNLSDAQIYDLILQPGFSTAKEITDVSGRGVGMDVVKDGIEKFRGNLDIESSIDKGTKFNINLPLTMAIIDGMLVRVGNEKYVIPTIAIHRTFQPSKEEYFTVENKGELIREREQLIPLIRLSDVFNSKNNSKPVWESLVIVVESKDEQKAILIDELLGKDEYVIKSLGGGMEEVPGLAGGAILSDGKVGLILDVHGIFDMANNIN